METMKRASPKLISAVLLLSAFIGFATPLASRAQGQTNSYSANFLLPGCKAATSGVRPPRVSVEDIARCIGLIEGLEVVTNFGVFCPPDVGTTGQRINVIVAYIEARPERMHEDIRKLAIEAMRKAWPC